MLRRRTHKRTAEDDRHAPTRGDDRPVTTRRDDRPGLTRGGRGALLVGVGGGLRALARVVRLAALLVALVIGAAIVLRVLGANSTNSVVSAIHDAGKALVGPFDGMFRLRHATAAMAVNWGIALLIYLIAGSLIASYVRRMAVAGRRAGVRGLRTRPV